MTVIQNIVKDATGAPVVNASVTIRLVGAPAFDSTTSSETVQPGPVTTDANGMWSKDLTPVSHYSPAGCYYTVSEPGGSLHAFTVPDAGGPYWLNAVLTVAPTAPEASLLVLRGDVEQAWTLDEQAQGQMNLGITGAVDSVNGQTGAVVLGAADVGADAAGAAATAQAAAIAASQPLDSDLTAIAALTTTVYGRSLLTAADAAALRTAAVLGTAATANTGDFDASGAAAAAQSAAISAAATDATTKANAAQAAAIAASQPLDSDLTAIAALTTTSFGRSFLALADAADARALLALGGAATLNVGTTTGTVAAGDDSRIAGAVPKSTVTAKGDLIVATGSGAVTNLAVGADGTVPVADSTQAGGWRAGAFEAVLSQPGISGDYLTPQFYVGSGNSVGAILNEVRYALIYLPRGTYNGLGVRTGGSGGTAGAVLRIGLYKPDAARGLPGTLIVDGGTVPATSTYSYQAVTLGSAVVWPGGLAWCAVVAQVAASSYVGFTSDMVLGASVVNSDNTTYGNNANTYKTIGISGSLASNPTMTYQGNNAKFAPQLGVKVQ